MVSRRALLRGLGASVAVGLAGCSLLADSGEPETRRPADEPEIPVPTSKPTATLTPTPSTMTGSSPTPSPTATRTLTQTPTQTPTRTVAEVAGTAVVSDVAGARSPNFGTAIALKDDVALISGADWGVAVFDAVDDGWVRTGSLEPPDLGGTSTHFTALAVSGDASVVGHPTADPSGVACVFGPERLGWPRQTTLSPARDVPSHYPFGKSVAVDGETIVVGATYDGTPEKPEVGSAFVFDASGENWTQRAELGNDAPGLFGRDVAVSGETVLVGAPLTEGSRRSDFGAAAVYERSDVAWRERATLTGPDPPSDEWFGAEVALDGDIAVVCSHSTWTVSVFERVGTTGTGTTGTTTGTDGAGGDGDWVQRARLDPDTGWKERFGATVAIDGDFVLVGAPRFAQADSDTVGGIYVYRRDDWRLERVLVPTDPPKGMTFGDAIALHDGTVVVGAPVYQGTGRAYVFDL